MLLSHPSGEHTPLPNNAHTTCITVLEWSSNGGRLVTGDQAGVMVVWRVDARGKLQGSPLIKHDYSKPLTCCIFRPPPPAEDVAMLARAAVSGDETALDMFNWKKSNKGAAFALGSQEGLAFFISTADGSVFSVDEQARSVPLLSVESAVQKMWYSKRRAVLAVVTDSLLLSQFSLGPEGIAHEIKVLAAGTSRGRVALWHMVTVSDQKGDMKIHWKLQTPAEVEGNISQLQWGSSSHLLAVCSSSCVVILSEHVMCSHYSQQMAAVQLTPAQLSLANFNTNTHITFHTDTHIRAVQVTKVNGRPDNKVYFYDIELDTLLYFDFFTGRPESSLDQSEDGQRSRCEGELAARCPVSQFWDENEPRLFVCETVPANSDLHSSSQSQIEKDDVLVVTFFVTQEHGLLLQDSQPKPATLLSLLALDTPYYYYICKLGEDGDRLVSTPAATAQVPSSPQMVVRRALRDFVGLESCEKQTRDAMLNFSFYLTIGDMDEAFKAIKLIKSHMIHKHEVQEISLT
ncbi:intraflagellar transport protein 140-like [Labeo rohita]|uniref:Intraflagellar transport protein 140-like n=1 Tax=Labeo rohita TaxID=84645 RepID=A0A498LLA1_LABRO|nr:intraflagellar transport protein 140-like [Labeo rohita]